MAKNRQEAAIVAIEYHLPEQVLTNEDLASQYPDWSIDKIFSKTGVRCRHIAAPDETASDMAVAAAEKLFASGAFRREDISLLVLCTQSPDYALPTTACIVQDRLKLPTTCAAFDFNLGCSGFVMGLSIVKGLLESRQIEGQALLLTAETYSKWIDPNDRSVRTIFGDGAAAVLVQLEPADDDVEFIGPFVFGTDGAGFQRLIVRESGARRSGSRVATLPGCPPCNLFMDGPEIFNFTIKTVPLSMEALLRKAGRTLEQIDLVVFHQANSYMLEHLRKRCNIPADKFVVDLENYGNTVSSTIPIVLKNLASSGRLKDGTTVAVVGFGVGYSWASGLLTWTSGGGT